MKSILNSKSNISSKRKVFVGMSGGVDSSVSAYLLKKAGYDVTGVFIKVWQPNEESGAASCDWKDERRDAMRVAAVLDIPFLTFDFSAEYKREVVDYMVSEYKSGRTPNPDVMCNRHIKFGSFLKEALNMDADYVATGHYAQNITESARKDVKDNVSGQDKTMPVYSLTESLDKNKDQSYFLWTLEQQDLRHILFPVGHLKKDEVRAIAERAGLPTFDKKDSQGVCFIGHLDMKTFLKEHLHIEKGQVLNTNGEIIGEHDGAALYTVGERHGLTIFDTKTKNAHTQTSEHNSKSKEKSKEPHFIISKNVADNTLVAVPESEFELKPEAYAPHEVTLEKTSWIEELPKRDKKYGCRIRYRQEKQDCVVKIGNKNEGNKAAGNKKVTVIFDKPQRGMAEGQSLVLYDGERCLGGGILTLLA